MNNPIYEINNTDLTVKIAGKEIEGVNEFLKDYCVANGIVTDKQRENFMLETFINPINESILDYIENQRYKHDCYVTDDYENDYIQIGLTSQVVIYNPNDTLESIIKNIFMIGQVFKSLKSMYEQIGFENLGIKNLNGGKQKTKAYQTVSQYLSLGDVENKKRAKIITDIYEIPHYIIKEDGRGKRGFYIDRIIPIMMLYLSHINDEIMYTTTDKLSKIMHIVRNNYKNDEVMMTALEIIKNTMEITSDKYANSLLREFYMCCKPERDKIIFTILDKLQDEYSALSYFKTFRIYTKNGKHYASDEECAMIRSAQRKVLTDYGFKRIIEVFFRRKEVEFYSRVVAWINKKHKVNWTSYCSKIKIIVDFEELNRILPNFTIENNFSARYDEISERFIQRMYKVMTNKYNQSHIKADEAVARYASTMQHEIKELYDIGVFDLSDIEYKAMSKSERPFRYTEKYLDMHKDLIPFLVKDELPERVNSEEYYSESELPF